MFLLYLVAVITILAIVLWGVLRREKMASSTIHSMNAAFDHLQSGVAQVTADGKMVSVNQSLATILNCDPKALKGRAWLDVFPPEEHERVEEAFSRMLLAGRVELDTYGQRADGSFAWLNVRLVAVHDRRMRFVGHHCLVLDSTRVRLLEARLQELHQETDQDLDEGVFSAAR
jgi:PAS domain S-box-containing protein